MDGTHFSSSTTPINPPHPNRQKKLQLISASKIDFPKKNSYNDQNPYALTKNSTQVISNKSALNQQTSSNRDTVTQTSSQKSAKVVRTNGLSKVQKPNIENTRGLSKDSNNYQCLSHSKINLQNGHLNHCIHFNQIPHQRANGRSNTNNHLYYNSNNNNRYMSPSKLQQENTSLRLQNAKIKQQLLNMQITHSEQINSLKEHIEKLYQMSKQLEESINIQGKQWIRFQCNLTN